MVDAASPIFVTNAQFADVRWTSFACLFGRDFCRIDQGKV